MTSDSHWPTMFTAVFLSLCLALFACSRERDADKKAPETTEPAPAPRKPAVDTESGGQALPALDLRTARVVDLTHALDQNTLFWPTSPSSFELTKLHAGMTEGGFYYASNSFCTPEHGGTHLDAPVHFAEGAQSTDQIPIDRLVGPAVVIDVRAQAAKDPDYRLGKAEIDAWEQRHGTIPADAIVLLWTGWSEKWPDRKAYFGDDKPGDASNLHFPSYGPEGARILIEQRKVAALGLDTASIDHGPTADFPVHQIAGKANVAGLENLTNLDELPPTGAWVAALPIKIAGGSGGPARVVAFLP